MPRKTKTSGTRRRGVAATVTINEIEIGTLVAVTGNVRLIARRWLTSKHCGCHSRPPSRGEVPDPPADGYVFNLRGVVDSDVGDDAVRVCGACAVKLALAILEHEVR